MNTPCDQLTAWAALERLRASRVGFNLNVAFREHPARFQSLSQSAAGIFVDYSKCLWDDAVLSALFALAEEAQVFSLRDAMFNAQPINETENRLVMHWLLRTPKGAREGRVCTSLHEQTLKEQEAFLSFAERVRADAGITDIVNIGIGGSDLGPQMAVKALEEFAATDKTIHFVSNIDPQEIEQTLKRLKPASTLFIIASKTFTTLETMANAQLARAWFERNQGVDAERHFIGVTSNAAQARALGITTTFGFSDWVGGRYSVWSSVGLSLAIAIGAEGFREFLRGAYEMDLHFRSAPPAQNIPLILGLLDIWYRNFLDFKTRCIAPYCSRLGRLPAYWQQLEMESNGKSIGRSGQALKYATAPVLWGEPGTNGQHAFFQMLHQGSDITPVEFIVVKEAGREYSQNHELLLANALAQAQAFMQGDPKFSEDGVPQGPDTAKHFSGNRPSLFTILERLTPTSLGALIALSEHRTFVGGAVWGINSFDQFGVELGKRLAQHIVGQIGSKHPSGLDPSSQGLMRALDLGSGAVHEAS